jgi:VWFA-related protein
MKHWHFAARQLLAVSVFLCSVFAQAPPTTAGSAQPASSSQQPPTFQSNTRLVTIEVVARDHRGQPVQGLTAADFQVFEQIAPKRDQHPQKIAVFHPVDRAAIAAQDIGRQQLLPGVYTNLVTMDKHPVPPTILLIDGLNTDFKSQLQVHHQTIQMLASLPGDTPVAVFLLGRGLRMIQSFTTDPEILKAALQKAHSAESNANTQLEPQDDPTKLSLTMNDSLPADVAGLAPNAPAGSNGPVKGPPPNNIMAGVAIAVERFERENYASEMDTRVRDTLEALRAIARHVAGYSGRKNLLWISSSFPIAITPNANQNLEFAGLRNYQGQITEVARALADAKVAIYPMDPTGVQTQAMFQPDFHTPDFSGVTGQYSNQQLSRESVSRIDRNESMEVLADETGGAVCAQDNDLGDCVKKAVNDSSSFYEIAYYPAFGNWDGKFHKIIVKSNKSGLHLGYRNGYYARGQASDQKSSDRELQEATCNDYLVSTSVLIVARQIPADQKGKAKYYMGIHPAMLTFTPQSDGSRELVLKIGVCGFDKSGKPLQFMEQAVDSKLTDKQFAGIQAQHGVPDTIALDPAPGVATVRLLVQDVETGKMGSVNLPYAEMVASASTTATPTPAAQTAH